MLLQNWVSIDHIVSFFVLVVLGVAIALATNVMAAHTVTPVMAAEMRVDPSDLPFQLTQHWRICAQRGIRWREADFFETDRFYINICWYGNQLRYIGMDKSDSENTIELPARFENRRGFIAENGAYRYVVNGATLRIYWGDVLMQEDAVYPRH